MMRMSSYLVVFIAASCLLPFLPAGVRVAGRKLDKGWDKISLSKLPEKSTLRVESQTGQSYRILNAINGKVYIGGNETLLALMIDGTGEIQKETNELDDFKTNEPPGLTIRCHQQNDAEPELVCWNFIRVVEPFGDELYVCGTNARSPLCYNCLMDLSNCRSINSTETRHVPRLPDDIPMTGLFPRDDGHVLYGGSLKDETFVRSNVDADGRATVEKDTVSSTDGFIEGPTFVGKPFLYNDPGNDNKYVFFFYRELAVEYSGQGKILYSRIARVCQNDTGGVSNTEKFVTFIKARLNCSLPDTLFPYHFSEIQDVIWREGEEEAYAVLTSPTLAPKASALCRYRMEDIMNLFDGGDSKEQQGNDPNSQWLPVTKDPRPGTCTGGKTTAYPPLLDKLVPNYNPLERTSGEQLPPPANFNISDTPTLHVDGVLFTSLAIDFDNCVYYFGTSVGTVLMAYKSSCTDPDESFCTVEITDLGNEGNPVTGLELLGDGSVKPLVITTKEDIIVLTLPPPLNTLENRICSARCPEECKVLGPLCQWQGATCNCSTCDNCTTEPPRYIVNAGNSTVNSCDNLDVFLYCQVDFGLGCDRPVEMAWVKEDKNNFIKNNSHFFTLTTLSAKLLELRVLAHEDTNGTYSCTATVDGVQSVPKRVDLVVESCLTAESLNRRCKMYQDLHANHPEVEDGTCEVETESCNTCSLGYYPLN